MWNLPSGEIRFQIVKAPNGKANRGCQNWRRGMQRMPKLTQRDAGNAKWRRGKQRDAYRHKGANREARRLKQNIWRWSRSASTVFWNILALLWGLWSLETSVSVKCMHNGHCSPFTIFSTKTEQNKMPLHKIENPWWIFWTKLSICCCPMVVNLFCRSQFGSCCSEKGT